MRQDMLMSSGHRPTCRLCVQETSYGKIWSSLQCNGPKQQTPDETWLYMSFLAAALNFICPGPKFTSAVDMKCAANVALSGLKRAGFAEHF